jgi:methylated-DNA-[protein]-cysteine S-methyltransferase
MRPGSRAPNVVSMKTLLLRRFESPIGTLLWVADPQDVVHAMSFDRSRHVGETSETSEPSRIEGRLRRYFAGDVHALDDIEVALHGTDFQRKVWTALREIPAGTTMSYGELAKRMTLADPRAAYEIGVANASNPIGLIAPCHRATGKNGDLKGFAWGVARKRWLLNHEHDHTQALAARRA